MSDDNDNTGGPTKVGYKSPPKKHQFKNGNKGNPWGCKGMPRPPTPFLDGHVTLTIDGRKVRVTRAEAIDHALFKEAMSGNVSAAKRLEERRNRESARNATSVTEEAISDQDAAALNRFIERQLKERTAGSGELSIRRRKQA